MNPGLGLAPRALRLGDGELPLLSGAVHYFRLPPRVWGRCLAAVKSLGLPMVETYVPWGVHEVRKGRFDWSGQRDLGAFLDAAAGEGLKVLLRPGPHINAELAFFGLPERIVADPTLVQRTARGTPALLMVPPRGFAGPSYASLPFLDEVKGWYQAVGEVVAPRLYPSGPVVAIQVDNEHAFFFRCGPYDADYHESALARFRDFAGGAEPPRRFDAHAPEDLAPHLRWLAFREQLVVDSLAELRRLLGAAGLGGVVHTHNFPPIEPSVYDLPRTEAVLDVAGIDLYHTRRQYPVIKRRSLYLAGNSRLPYVPEMGLGGFPWGPPADDLAATMQLQTALMHGVAGCNFYMLVDRDRWYGSPVASDGTVRPGLADTLRRLTAALAEVDFFHLERRAEVGLLVPRDYQRLAVAASHAGPIGPAFAELLQLDETMIVREERFGLDGPVAYEQAAWKEALVGALDRSRAAYVHLDASQPLAALRRYRALVVPTFDFLDRGLVERLRAFADGGGALLAGPRQPSRDQTLEPAPLDLPGSLLPAAGLSEPGQIDLALQALLDRAGVARHGAVEAEVDVATHCRSDGAPALLFVANRGHRPVTATVPLESGALAVDLLGGKSHPGATLSLPLGPHDVRLLRLG